MPLPFHEKLQKLKYMDFHAHDRHQWLTVDISEDDILGELERLPGAERYLGKYSRDDVMDLLERRGIMRKLSEMGFEDVGVEIRTDEVHTHRLYVYSGEKDYDHILIELRLREGFFSPRENFIPGFEIGRQRMIMVDWLMLQNPIRKFTADRPALPRQDHPGLGLLNDLIPVIIEAAKETGRAGILDTPEHYHGALFYSRWFHFINPEVEGRFLAMRRDLAGHPLHTASRAVDLGCLKNLCTGRYEKWVPGEQVLPVSELMVEYFQHEKYKEIKDKARLENSYRLDMEKYEQRMKEETVMEEMP
jgi:hypothetical protein